MNDSFIVGLATFVIIIVLLFTYQYHTKWFVDFTHSVIGKLIACSIILFYTSINKIYGLFCCASVILFFSLESTKWIQEGFFEIPSSSMDVAPTGRGSSILISTPYAGDKEDTSGPHQRINSIIQSRKEAKEAFQKNHCNAEGVLMHKNIPVNKNFPEIIYPEIRFRDDRNICDVCDKGCDYQVNGAYTSVPVHQ